MTKNDKTENGITSMGGMAEKKSVNADKTKNRLQQLEKN